MSNGIGKNASQKKAVKSALERIDGLERDLVSVVNAIGQQFGLIQKQLGRLSEVSEALAAEIGTEQVETTILTIRARKQTEAAAAQKATLDRALADKTVYATDTITDASIIVGVEKDKDGVEIHPGRVQLGMSEVKPEYKEKLVGQKVGFVMDTENGNTFVVGEIYNFSAPVAPAVDAAPTDAVTPAVDVAPVAPVADATAVATPDVAPVAAPVAPVAAPVATDTTATTTPAAQG